jgi:hypothetical protein
MEIKGKKLSHSIASTKHPTNYQVPIFLQVSFNFSKVLLTGQKKQGTFATLHRTSN